mgnify:FL=1
MAQKVLNGYNYKTCTCKRKVGELPVRGDLAYTPAQMYEAAKAGVPISSQNISQLPSADFMDENSWIVPVEYRRNTDIADVWNAQRDARSKIVAAYRKSREESV